MGILQKNEQVYKNLIWILNKLFSQTINAEFQEKNVSCKVFKIQNAINA